MIEDRNNVGSSLDLTYDRNVRISPSEFVSLSGSFHVRLNALFEEIRTASETTARHKVGNCRSSTFK